jgi:Domain of unknown function (DUF4262)
MADHDAFLRHQFLRRQDQLIDLYGWAVTAVAPTPDDPGTPFAYTVGLTEHDRPELVIAGLDPAIAQALLGDLADRVVHHAARFTHGQRITDLIAGYDAVIVDGPVSDELYPGTAIGRYGADRVRLQQIVWPDPHARFPWDPGYQYPPQAQPLLGRP